MCAAATAGASYGAAGGAPAPGSLWQTEDGKFVIRIDDCGGAGGNLCGDLVWLKKPLDKTTGEPKLDKDNPDPALRDRPVCGLRIVTGLEPAGDNRWVSGHFYNPDDGGTYGAQLRLDPDTGVMALRGYIAVSMLGKTMHLYRLDDPIDTCG